MMSDDKKESAVIAVVKSLLVAMILGLALTSLSCCKDQASTNSNGIQSRNAEATTLLVKANEKFQEAMKAFAQFRHGQT